jgi:large subunit ribosomal protein L4
MKLPVYDIEAKKVSEIEVNEAVFGITPNTKVVADVILMQRASLRQGTHSTKTRAEVRGGGRKPWAQKGTGRARQGSIRSPQWRGGGVVFGPTPRDYSYKLPRKVRRLALRSVLSQKVLDGRIMIVDNFDFVKPNTKTFIKMMEDFKVEGKTMVVMNEENENALLSGRNVQKVTCTNSTGVNVLDLVNHRVVLMTIDAVKKLEEVLG